MPSHVATKYLRIVNTNAVTTVDLGSIIVHGVLNTSTFSTSLAVFEGDGTTRIITVASGLAVNPIEKVGPFLAPRGVKIQLSVANPAAHATIFYSQAGA